MVYPLLVFELLPIHRLQSELVRKRWKYSCMMKIDLFQKFRLLNFIDNPGKSQKIMFSFNGCLYSEIFSVSSRNPTSAKPSWPFLMPRNVLMKVDFPVALRPATANLTFSVSHLFKCCLMNSTVICGPNLVSKTPRTVSLFSNLWQICEKVVSTSSIKYNKPIK